jgi:hypothetical protein
MAAYCIKACSQIQDIVACWLKKRFLRLPVSGNKRDALFAGQPTFRRACPEAEEATGLSLGFQPWNWSFDI